MTEPTANGGVTEQEIRERLKRVLREVRGGEGASGGTSLTPEKRQAVKHLLAHASPVMIAQAEQELVAEGFTIQDLTSACDVHLELFREAASETRFDLPQDHPISQFEIDHEVIFDALARLRAAVTRARTKPSLGAAAPEIADMKGCAELLLAAENHNVRQENTLFPMLERYGIEQPPAIMWQEHADMREDKKLLAQALGEATSLDDLVDSVEGLAVQLAEEFALHSRKERQILYPAALELFTPEDWRDIKEECDNLGYFTRNLSQA